MAARESLSDGSELPPPVDSAERSPSIIDVLEHRAATRPEWPIYTFLSDDGAMAGARTTAQIAARARAGAAWLQQSCQPGDRVLLLAPPGLDYIDAFFACLAAGVYAVPAYPPDPTRLVRTLPRLRAIVGDAQPRVVLTTSLLLALAEPIFELAPELRDLTWVAIDEVDDSLADGYARPALSRKSIAYLQYTSGSTADPKGVVITHDNVLENALAMWCVSKGSSDSRIVSWMPPYHDFGLVVGIFLPIVWGSRSILMSPIAFLRTPLVWLRAISDHRGTISEAANFALELCLRKTDPASRAGLDLSSLELVVVGGEPLRADTLRRFDVAFAPCRLRPQVFVGGWGLAEATLCLVEGTPGARVVKLVRGSALRRDRVVEVSTASADSVELVTCGQPLPGNEILVVDPQSRTLCQPGHIGELWASGPAVSQGYWRQPEATRDVFRGYLSHDDRGPFLRTGDLGFVDQGEVFVTGRMKDVIIIRGQNHYPHDIERTVEESDPTLRAGCSVAFSIDVAGNERLVVVSELKAPQDVDTRAVAARIRANVARDHALRVETVVFIPPGALPKTSSGKVQRQPCRRQFLDGSLEILGRMDGEGISSAAPPRSEPEEQQGEAAVLEWLVTSLAQELHLEPSLVSPDLPIAMHGVDSLAAVSLVQTVEDHFGCRIPVSSFFEDTTLRELAAAVQVARRSCTPAPTPLTRARGGADYPLSHGQRGLWFLHQLAPGSAAYNVVHAVRILGRLDATALARAFEGVVARHEAFRCTFHVGPDGQPHQRVRTHTDACFEEIDAGGYSANELAARVRSIAAHPFDLEARPPLRVVLLRCSAEEHVLVFAAHHLVADYWSLAVVNRELGTLFEAAQNGVAAALPAPIWRHRDYVHAEHELLATARLEELGCFWDEQLAGELPVLDLPTDRPRPPVQTFRGSSLRAQLDRERGAAIRRCAAEASTTPYVVLLAAFQSLLHRYSRQPDVIVGSPVAGRRRREWAEVVGYFANPVPLRALFGDDPPFAEIVARTRIAVLGALDHQELPFPTLVERRHPSRDLSRSPIFQAMFIMPDAPATDEEGLLPVGLAPRSRQTRLGELVFEPWSDLDRGAAQLDLMLMALEVDGAFELVWEYDTSLFDASTIECMSKHYRNLLDAALQNTATRVSELSLLTTDERRFLITDCNATARPLPRDLAVHRLVEVQAARAPRAPAVGFRDDWVSYEELARRARRLAMRLQRGGVTSGTRVAVLVERSVDLVVALLGVLQAGAAYVPLDPALPRARLRLTIADASVARIVVHAPTDALLGEIAASLVYVDENGCEAPGPADRWRSAEVSGDDLAYVIYTSGSTGTPKGVEVTHRALANLLLAMSESPGLGPSDTLLAVTTISFDIAALEMFLPLVVGARLVLASPEEAADGRALGRLLRASGATAMQATPASWRMLVDAGWRGSSAFKVLCGGDVLDRNLADALLERAGSVWNLYGPTETTIWSAVARVTAGAGPVPVGRPIANTQLHVLDERLEPLPLGVHGELCIAGVGLARGYVNLPELTRERFVAVPPELGRRVYRTGDVARRLPGGEIDLLGRRDRQVKVRGFRVELGEIEAVLRQQPAVVDAAVVVHGEGTERRLAAYVVLRPEGAEPEGIRTWLRERLPHYMVPVPGWVVPVERLPVTRAGKIDRAALPDPVPGSSRAGASRGARTDRERLLLQIWRQALRLQDVGVTDDFFSLGGDSLGAAELAARISHATGREVELRALLSHPTVATLAAYLDGVAEEDAPLARADDVAGAAPHHPPPFVELERRPLLTLHAAGRLASVDGAAIGYLPATLPSALHVTRSEIAENWCSRLPLFAGVATTMLGRIGLIALPYFDDELQVRIADVRTSLREAIEIAGRIGARVVSLTGLLPALTDYGRDLPHAGNGAPAITTGHATTAATVVLSLRRILAESGRELARESVGVLGLGSVGMATLRLMLRCLPEPERILLCDVFRKREQLDALRRELVDTLGVASRIETLEARDEVPAGLYESTLIVGAASVGSILDVTRVRPGTLIVDDSAPHCFDRRAAETRLRERGDILFTEGGVLRSPEPISRLLHLPHGAENLASLLAARLPGLPGTGGADEITGCVLSCLLSTRFVDLPPTLGLVEGQDSLAHYEKLRALGFEAATLHCEDFAPSPEAVARFRARAAGQDGGLHG